MRDDVWGISKAEAAKSPTPDLRVARLAAEQNTIVSTRQLRACGLTSDAITVRTRRGALHRVHRGVYSVVAPAALTVKARLTAAVLACGDRAALSHFAAAVWWEMARWDRREPDVTVVGDGGRRIDGIRVHRTRALDRRDVYRRERIWITSPARTALDLAAGMTERELRRMLRQAQAEGRLGVGQLREVVTRADRRRGASALRAVVADGHTPTRSVAEDLLLDLIERARLPRPQVNASLTLDGLTLMPDFLWRAQRLVVEVDGARFHSGAQARREDARRQAILEAHGQRVLRVSYEQLTQQAAQTVARIAHALARPP